MPFDANLNNADSDDDDDGNENQKPGPRRPAKKDVGTKKGNDPGKRPQPKRRPAEKDVGAKKGNVGKKKDVGAKKGNAAGKKKDVGTKKGKLDGKSKTVTGGTKTKGKDVRKKAQAPMPRASKGPNWQIRPRRMTNEETA